jgi:DNA-binding HxlR family transcriptional regulator
MASKKETWCPLRLVLGAIEGKWTAHILRELLTGTKRHSELSRSLAGINPKTLTDRLRDLERAGIVSRKMFQEIPPRVEYSLTNRGRELRTIFGALSKLGTSWQESIPIDISAMQGCPHCLSDKKR